jgi:threonine aldolase
MKQIDLRSDTVTRPTTGMRAAMAAADVGDDVYGEDPSVNRLEALAAQLLGKESALFVPSGTQGNLLGVMSHCERGDEYIVGQQAHTYKYEGGGAAVLGSIQPQPLEFEPDGTLDLDRVAAAIKPDDAHFARTRLLCLENTQAGKVLPLDYLARAHAFARGRSLMLHLDGARVFNAAVKLGVAVRDIAAHFDTISVCLSKGLGAPVGSVLCGPADLIREARRIWILYGGAWRQAGMIAAAGLVALEDGRGRLIEDHRRARRLGEAVAELLPGSVELDRVVTNMVFVDTERMGLHASVVLDRLAAAGVGAVPVPGGVRMVTHLDVDDDGIASAIDAWRTIAADATKEGP